MDNRSLEDKIAEIENEERITKKQKRKPAKKSTLIVKSIGNAFATFFSWGKYSLFWIILVFVFQISTLIFLVTSSNPMDGTTLTVFRVAFVLGIASLIIGVVLLVMLIIGFEVLYNEEYLKFTSGIVAVVIGVFCVIWGLCSVENLSIKSFYNDTEYGILYVEKETEYFVKQNNGTQHEVIIHAKINGKPVHTIKEASNGFMETLIFEQGGDYTIKNKAFRNSYQLKTIALDGAKCTFSENSFDYCEDLTDIYIKTGELKGNWVYFSSNPTLHIDGGTFNAFCNSINFKIGTNGGAIELGMGANNIPVANIWLDDNIKMEKMNVIPSTTFGFKRYYLPIAENIYIPATTKTIPKNFFGERESCRVYYSGTQEMWENILIEEEGNSNYWNGSVDIIFNYNSEE